MIAQKGENLPTAGRTGPLEGFRAIATGISGIRAVSAASGHSFARHSHDEFGIGAIIEGAQISASGRGQVQAERGDVITVNPGEIHDGAPCGDRGRRWFMFYLTPGFAETFADGLGLARAAEFAAPVLRRPQLSAGLVRLGLRLAGGCDGPAVLEERLLPLLATAMAPRAFAEKAPQPAALARLLAEIDADPARPHDLPSLAAPLGLSRFQTLRAFFRATGLTPHAYLLDRRVRRASELIRAGDCGLAGIAAQTGFADQAHLTREFKRRHGLTPGAYRAGLCNRLQDHRRP